MEDLDKMDLKELVGKWTEILAEGKKIKSAKVQKSTALMLENESKYLVETGNYTQPGLNRDPGYAHSGDFHHIAIPMVRRTFPELIAHEVVGVQPMTGPVGLAFALRFRAGQTYSDINSNNQEFLVPDAKDILGNTTSVPTNELGYNLIDTAYSGTYVTSAGELIGSFVGTPSSAQTDGSARSVPEVGLGVGSGTSIKEVNMTVEKAQVEAKTRKLRSRWSLEVAQDLKAMHGLDLEEEMLDILAYEITAEIDREIVVALNSVAISSGWDYTNSADADGRWQSEKYRTLYNMIIRKANRIAILTRRGAGNFVIASPYAVAALESLSSFVIHPTDGDINTLVAGVSKMGSLDGRITVFRDTFAIEDYVTVGYKGPSEYDAGIIYLPYIQLMVSKTVFEQSFHPTVGLMSRYALHSHIFGANLYYQRIRVFNLPN
jgi:hypothetical protein